MTAPAESTSELKRPVPRRIRSVSDPLPLALRYHEAAELLGVSERQIYNLVDAGRLQRARLGPRCVRIVTSSAIALIEART